MREESYIMDIILTTNPSVDSDDDPLPIVGKSRPLKLNPSEFAHFVWNKFNWSIKSIESELNDLQLTRDEIEFIILSLPISRINSM